jgi:hypothetical protein
MPHRIRRDIDTANHITGLTIGKLIMIIHSSILQFFTHPFNYQDNVNACLPMSVSKVNDSMIEFLVLSKHELWDILKSVLSIICGSTFNCSEKLHAIRRDFGCCWMLLDVVGSKNIKIKQTYDRWTYMAMVAAQFSLPRIYPILENNNLAPSFFFRRLFCKHRPESWSMSIWIMAHLLVMHVDANSLIPFLEFQHWHDPSDSCPGCRFGVCIRF